MKELVERLETNLTGLNMNMFSLKYKSPNIEKAECVNSVEIRKVASIKNGGSIRER